MASHTAPSSSSASPTSEYCLPVPVPANVSSFREVQVQGNKALLVTTTGQDTGPHRHFGGSGSFLMWADGEMVYCLCGNLAELELTEMANSLQ